MKSCLRLTLLMLSATALPLTCLQAADPAQGETRQVHVVDKQGLKVTADKAVYRHGEVMELTVEIPRDGFLRVYAVNSDGSTTVLFPNKWLPDHQVKSGVMKLGAKQDPFDLLVTLADGQTEVQERIHAVFSTKPFSTDPLDWAEGFAVIGVTNSEERATRGLTPKARPSAGAQGAPSSSWDVELDYRILR